MSQSAEVIQSGEGGMANANLLLCICAKKLQSTTFEQLASMRPPGASFLAGLNISPLCIQFANSHCRSSSCAAAARGSTNCGNVSLVGPSYVCGVRTDSIHKMCQEQVERPSSGYAHYYVVRPCFDSVATRIIASSYLFPHPCLLHPWVSAVRGWSIRPSRSS